MVKMDMQFYTELGKLLKKARENKKMSLDQLSDALHGIKKKSTLKRYEDGESRIDMEMLSGICDILSLDMADIIRTAGARADFSDFIKETEVGHSASNVSTENQQFATAEEAMQYIIKMPVVSAYGGYDLERMSDEEIIKLANQLTGVFKMLAEEYKVK